MMVEKDSNPREFNGRQPFGTKQSSQRKHKPSSSKKRRPKSRSRKSRSISRKSASKMRTQNSKIRNGATHTRNLGQISVMSGVEDATIEFNEDDAVSISEASSIKAYEHPIEDKASIYTEHTYTSWDNQSVASFNSEFSVQTAKDEALSRDELLDIDEETLVHMRHRSRSKDLRGQRVMHLSGLEVVQNEPIRAPESDSESDLDVDFSRIESNIVGLGKDMYSLKQRTDLCVYNKPDQDRMRRLLRKGQEKEKHRKRMGRELRKDRNSSVKKSVLKGRIAFLEDSNNKENATERVNFKDIQNGLESGQIEYGELSFDKNLLKNIDFGGNKGKRASKSRSKPRQAKKSKAVKQRSRGRNSRTRVSKMR
jgi:hypothetical protein